MEKISSFKNDDNQSSSLMDVMPHNKTKGNRRWSDEVKAKIVEESNQSGANVTEIAKRYGVAKSCLYAWRQKAVENKPNVAQPKNEVPAFVPLMAEDDRANGVDDCSSTLESIEIKIGNVSLSFKQATLEQISTLVKRLNGAV